MSASVLIKEKEEKNIFNILAITNKHIRDNNIIFYEDDHHYEIITSPHILFTSVTTLISPYFNDFDRNEAFNKMIQSKNWNISHKNWGKSREQLFEEWEQAGKDAAALGTALHLKIELFMNVPLTKKYYHQNLLDEWNKQEIKQIKQIKQIRQTKLTKWYNNIILNCLPLEQEWRYFLNYTEKTKNLKPYRTEWVVYYEEYQLAGSIDMVYENPDGTLLIYDWKRVKNEKIAQTHSFKKNSKQPFENLPMTHYWQYAMQLNLYKRIIEDKYEKKVSELAIVILHPDNPGNDYYIQILPDMSQYIDMILKIRIEQIHSKTK